MTVRTSLRAQLLAWILGPLTLLLGVNLWISFSSAKITAGLVQDTALLASARSIAEQISERDGTIEVLIPPSAIERFSSSDRDRVVYRVLGPAGDLLAGYPDVPSPPKPIRALEAQWYDSRFRSLPIRAVALGQPLTGGEAQPATVIVGQTLQSRSRMEHDLWLRTAWQQALLVATAGILALIGLARGLRPLLRWRDAVRAQDPRSLSRFDSDAVQSELKPLVLALNAAIGRIEEQIKQRRQFIADAAHQLRTPLALLRTQAAVGRKTAKVAEKDETLDAIATTSAEMTRLTNQLLTLARAGSVSTITHRTMVDLANVLRAVLTAEAQRAITGGLELSFESVAEPALVWGNQRLLTELVTNLVDNALRYTPAGGAIVVSVTKGHQTVCLTVADTGPGIPQRERERVFERFYRTPGVSVEGSGLGLAIARAIVEAHRGQIMLKDPADGPGLVVEVQLPAVELVN
ncbi:sensor histidine kinase [Microvirga puerhi]|uniref:histidine kinase n=1 Tax=Microvirga puerhi TaxID=2876078 RepID=A0ABS7VU15_9HYPH|nr:sensor histidine kinase [Microvirga puerhi]MBZ6079061.1 sensor histidine kinase [Microvirga puerhi]